LTYCVPTKRVVCIMASSESNPGLQLAYARREALRLRRAGLKKTEHYAAIIKRMAMLTESCRYSGANVLTSPASREDSALVLDSEEEFQSEPVPQPLIQTPVIQQFSADCS